MNATTIEIGPNAVALGLAFMAFLTTVYNGYMNRKTGKEFKPNGGSSMRDALDRIEQHSAATSAVVAPGAVSTPIGSQVSQPAKSPPVLVVPTPIPVEVTFPDQPPAFPPPGATP